ncbi:MAG: PKD domain-containing protein, partial [Bacteroidetes bacterium]|nr:PKD domain-containing protein [Bacteroidota bacterium]
MKLYRDCYTGVPPFDDPIYLSVYDSLENLLIQFDIVLPPIDTLDNNTYNLCLFSPPNVCVEEAVYTADFFLPPGRFHITYQRCCRNQGIVNIIDPQSVGAGWDIVIPEPSKAICNSSPYYNQYPPTIICLDSQFVYDHSATDPDGDSLVYYLCTPNDYSSDTLGIIPNPCGPPSSNYEVTYVSPYDSAYPIWAPVDSFKIDPQTGLLTGTPTQAGRYVVGVCVSEYRNGVLLSTNKRDFQFNVAQCVEEVAAGFTAAPPACDDLTVNLTNTSNQATYYFWDFGVGPDSLVTDTSSEETPTFTYPDYGNYTITMVVNAGLSCADTVSLNVYLYESPIADAGTDALISLGDSVIIGGDTTASGGTPPYTYLWTPGSFLDDPASANPTATPSDTLVNPYTITVTDANGCQNKDIDTVFIQAVDSR